MNLIEINTTQNVNLLTEKAGIGKRIGALIIDYIVLVFLTLFLFVFYDIFETSGYRTIFITGISMLWFFYHFLFEVFTEGQSLGKMSSKIRIVKTTGERAGVIQYFIRALLRPVDSIFGLGIIFIAFSEKNQRLGDIAASTMAIRLEEGFDVNEMVLTELPKDYSPMLSRSQIDKLEGKDIELIKRVLAEVKRTRKYEFLNKIKERILEVLDDKSDMLANKYLENVVNDYNYYA